MYACGSGIWSGLVLLDFVEATFMDRAVRVFYAVYGDVRKRAALEELSGWCRKSRQDLLLFADSGKCIVLYGRMDLKKNIFAVCDLDASYACNLTDYLNGKRTTPFEVQAFTNVESLQEFARAQPIELLLISTRAMCNEIRELPIGRIVILSEGEQLRDLNLEEYPFVYKYQSSDQLICEVMEYYAAANPNTCLFPATTDTKLIGIYSPVARSGKTAFALALGGDSSREQAGALSEFGGIFWLRRVIWDTLSY